MTSSDAPTLRPGDIERAASRVGSSYAGDPGRPQARVAVVCSKFNGGITTRLLDGALEGLEVHGVKLQSVAVVWVPGAFEVPLAALRMAESGNFDAVVGLGAVIKGETAHFDFVAGQCAAGLQRAALDTGVPVILGVLTTDTVDQALSRSDAGAANKGYEAVVTALEMADLMEQLPARAP